MERNYNIFQDWDRNPHYFKGKLVLVLFRSACFIRSSKILSILFIWYLLFYRVFVEWIMGIELSWNLQIGSGLQLFHGHALVINGNSVIGKNCVLRHCTTIGNKGVATDFYYKCPVIGDNVDIGSNVCIIGDITIGNNVIIGAGSVVTKSIPANKLVVGNPAKIIRDL